jgi:hypothetical protein
MCVVGRSVGRRSVSRRKLKTRTSTAD